MGTITYDATSKRWRRFLSREFHRDESEILSTTDLRTKFKLNAGGLRNLAPKLVELFSDVGLVLPPQSMDGLTTVGSGTRLIWSRIPEANRDA